jgi:hypothetical protein
MKIYRFNPLQLSFALLVTLSLSGCRPLSETGTAGLYVRNLLGVTDSINLETNGFFVQKVVFTNGAAWSCSGSWTLINRVAQLDKCYLSFDDERESIIIPPQTVYSCAFTVDGRELVRTKLQPPWIKVGVTK